MWTFTPRRSGHTTPRSLSLEIKEADPIVALSKQDCDVSLGGKAWWEDSAGRFQWILRNNLLTLWKRPLRAPRGLVARCKIAIAKLSLSLTGRSCGHRRCATCGQPSLADRVWRQLGPWELGLGCSRACLSSGWQKVPAAVSVRVRVPTPSMSVAASLPALALVPLKAGVVDLHSGAATATGTAWPRPRPARTANAEASGAGTGKAYDAPPNAAQRGPRGGPVGSHGIEPPRAEQRAEQRSSIAPSLHRSIAPQRRAGRRALRVKVKLAGQWPRTAGLDGRTWNAREVAKAAPTTAAGFRSRARDWLRRAR